MNVLGTEKNITGTEESLGQRNSSIYVLFGHFQVE